MSDNDSWSYTMAMTTLARNITLIVSRCSPPLATEIQHILWNHLGTSFPTVNERVRDSREALALVENLSTVTLGEVFSVMQRTKEGTILGGAARNFCTSKGEGAYHCLCNLIPNAHVMKEACSPPFLNWLGQAIEDPGTRNLLEDLTYYFSRKGMWMPVETPPTFSLRGFLIEMGVGTVDPQGITSESVRRTTIHEWRLLLKHLQGIAEDGLGTINIRDLQRLMECSKSPLTPLPFLEELGAHVWSRGDLKLLLEAPSELMRPVGVVTIRDTSARSRDLLFPSSEFGYRSEAVATFASRLITDPETARTLVQVMVFCQKHGGVPCLEGPDPCPFLDVLGIEGKEPDREHVAMARSETKQWATIVRYLEASERYRHGNMTQADVQKLTDIARHQGYSASLLSMATFVAETREDFRIIITGERGRISQMVNERVGEWIGLDEQGSQALGGQAGGQNRIRWVLENREVFRDHLYLLGSGPLGERIVARRAADFADLKSVFPRWSLPFSRIYSMVESVSVDTRLDPAEFGAIVGRTREVMGRIFPEVVETSKVRDELERVNRQLGKNLKARLTRVLGALPEDWSTEPALIRKLQTTLTRMAPELDLLERRDPARFSSLRENLESISGIVEQRSAQLYRSERLADLDLNEPKDLREALEWSLQYVQDPNAHGWTSRARGELLSGYESPLLKDLSQLSHLPSDGDQLVFRTWDRSLEDIFGGQGSADCTAPGGQLFEANFEWIEDPGTLILNVYSRTVGEGQESLVGRTYLFAVQDGAGPAVFLDSMEFQASFPQGEAGPQIVASVLNDLSHHLRCPIYLPIGRLSNREWVTTGVDLMKLPRKEVFLKKLGDDITIERESLVGRRVTLQELLPATVSVA